MERQPDDPLVTTAWLAERLDAPDVRVVDGSWFFPGQGDPRARYHMCHIPGAVFFDIDDVADEATDLPHMLPSPAKFASRMRRLGLGDGARIVVYDQQGLVTAARVWWSLRAMGHKDVVVLDGGLPKWIAEGRPVEDRPPLPRERHFTAHLDNGLVRSKAQVQRALAAGEQVVDARAADRFRGEAAEPRAGLRSGHMPGARNLPLPQLFAPDGAMLAGAKLRTAVEAAGVDVDRPVISTCGSGITACVLALALARLGHWRAAVYDGSWAEWGRPGDTAVATGEA